MTTWSYFTSIPLLVNRFEANVAYAPGNHAVLGQTGQRTSFYLANWPGKSLPNGGACPRRFCSKVSRKT